MNKEIVFRLDARKRYEDTGDRFILMLSLSMLLIETPKELKILVGDLSGLVDFNVEGGLGFVGYGIRLPKELNEVPDKIKYAVGLFMLTMYGIDFDDVADYLIDHLSPDDIEIAMKAYALVPYENLRDESFVA